MSQFMSKRKCSLAILAIMVLSFNLVALTGDYEQGLNYLRLAAENNSQTMSQKERSEYLEKAYRVFKESNQKNARLFQVYAGKLTAKDNEIKSVAVEFVKQYRSQYLPMIADLEVLSPDARDELKRYMLDIEEQIPFIEKIKLAMNLIFPFKGEQPAIHFSLNSRATVQFNVDGFPEGSRVFPKGIAAIDLKWKEEYIEKKLLMLKLNAKNGLSDYSEEKEILVDIVMPRRLKYYNGEYSMEGEYPKSETKTVTKRNGGTLVVGFILSALLGGAIYATKEDEKTGKIFTQKERQKRGLLAGGIGLGISFLSFLIVTRKEIVPHQGNIDYNRQLKAQIEELKKQIKVNFRIENEKEN
ncbi:MAG: hypothetical protein MUF15_12380 [Acidobacteria bacterium]|jgi:hypothetical protein|nr:hypothetical protein [Acidobacteriota bacterium]